MPPNPPNNSPGQASLLPGNEPVTLEGVVERIVYENAESGFMVARLRRDDQAELDTFVGTMMAISPGETIRVRGQWVDDRKFGKQVKVESYETVQPTSALGIEKYLGSGLIRGIGPSYAKRLVTAFGTETLEVIDKFPERLRQVEGIGKKRAEQIREGWEEQKSVQAVMVFLQGHGIGPGQAIKIYKRYGDRAVTVIRENPYLLSEDITGIGFAGADKIADALGIHAENPKRLQAGLLYTLRQTGSEGHVFINRDELFEQAAALLKAPRESLPEALTSLEKQRAIVIEQDAVYARLLYDAETGCDHHLKRLLAAELPELTIDVDNAIRWAEREFSISLSPEQNEAVRTLVDAKVMVITGGPGTGKTTLINSLLGILSKKGLSALLAAPTGRAAKRMEAATGREARTIHRLLEYSPKNGQFTRNEFNPLDADLVIIDEMSMVDVSLMNSMLKALPDPARLVMVGDVDQLPSVGPGNVLMDVIASNVIPAVRLQTVFRQAAESGIVSNAHRINSGQAPEFNQEDFFFVERPRPEDALETVLELVANRIPKKFQLYPLRDIQVMAPMHRGDAGVANLNTSLQAALNAEGAPLSRRGFRLGDKVIQQRNNYELDVYNGDVGIITLVDEEAAELHVQFEDRTVLYTFDDMDNLTLAYAITVHKSQGSEYPAVVLPLVSQHHMMLQRNVLYTAITRGKQLVIIVGDPIALHRALRNTDVTRRNTRLAQRLRNEI